jgi:hypothetical protein
MTCNIQNVPGGTYLLNKKKCGLLDQICLSKYSYSLRSIILFANIDVSRHILVVDVSFFWQITH